MPPGETDLSQFWRRWDASLGRETADHINIEAAGPWPELTTAHEIGHFLDFSGLQQDGSLSSHAPDKPLRLLMAEIQRTRTFKNIVKARDEAGKNAAAATGQAKTYYKKVQEYYDDYLLRPEELFARAYAQYAAWRSGDRTMLGQIDRILADPQDKLRAWPYADYLPLIHRFDTLFEDQGWLTRTKLRR